jgi:hypothetical protein
LTFLDGTSPGLLPRLLAGRGPAAADDQNLLFWRNVITLGAAVALFGLFAGLGDGLRFTITGPLFHF